MSPASPSSLSGHRCGDFRCAPGAPETTGGPFRRLRLRRSARTIVEAAAKRRPAVTYIGMDVHKQETQVCIEDAEGAVILEQRIRTTREVHPVYGVDVCNKASLANCKFDDASAWTPLDQMP